MNEQFIKEQLRLFQERITKLLDPIRCFFDRSLQKKAVDYHMAEM